MGNEHSKTKDGKINGKHRNESVNGLSANITSNGLEIGVNSETIVQQNGEPLSLNLATESTDLVVVESDCKPADAPVISEIPETIIQTEEVKEGNEDQTDVSPPATDPQPESRPSGEEAATVIVAVHRKNFQCPHRKAEISTQTDRKTEADISTQTGEDHEDMTMNTEDPVEEVVVTETVVITEDPLNESVVVIAEEAVEETANKAALGNQTAGIIIEEVVLEDNVYENIVFRAERVEVTDVKNYEPEEESMNGREETEQQIAEEQEPHPNDSCIEDKVVVEENNMEETEPLEVSFSLPKVVADCVEAVFTAVSESTDFVAVNTPEPNADEVITNNNGDGAGDVSADVVLTEIAEPESNAATPEAGETNGIPSPDKEPETMVIETILEVVREEPNPKPAYQDMPVEELSVPLVTVRLKVESAHEEVTTDDAVAVKDVPGIREQKQFDDEPSKKCNSCPGEKSMNGFEETEPEIAAEPESNKSIREDEIVSEEHNTEETESLEVSFSLPKVVADCVEAVFVAVSESTDFAAVNMSESSADDVITEDNSEGAGDMSADVVLIETAEPESNAVTLEAGEANGIPSSDEKPDTTNTETILKVIFEEPNPTPANQDMPVEELSVPPVTLLQVEVESAREEVTANDAVAVKDVPLICEQKQLNNEPLEKCDSCTEEEIIIVEVPSNELYTIEEPPEGTLSSPGHEVKPESIPKVIMTDEDAEVGEDVITNVGPERAEEAEASPVIVKEDAEVIMEAAIDALSQDLESCAITLQESYNIPLEEEVIAATTFVPLSGEQDTIAIPEEPVETVAEEIYKEAIEAPLNETEAVPQSGEEDTTGGEVNNIATSDKSMEESDMAEEKTEVCEEVLVLSESTTTPEQTPVFSGEPEEENPSPCEKDSTTEVLENTLESMVKAISEKSEVTENIVEELAHVAPTNTTKESEACITVQQELAEDSIAPAKVLLEDADKELAVEALECIEQIDSTLVISEEPGEENASLLERQPKSDILLVILETLEVTEKITEEIILETDNSGAVLAAAEENSDDATSDEPVSECIKAVLETIVKENITKHAAEWNLVTSVPEVITEEGTEEKTENISSMNSTDSTPDTQSVTGTDMEALIVRLQSACISAVEESVYRLGGLKLSSLGHRINVTIHVAPKEEQ